MTNKNLRNVLIEVAKANPENVVAQLLAYFYPTIRDFKREELFEFLHSKIENSDQLDLSELNVANDQINTAEFENQDYRIKSFEISSLRGIPDAENNVPFGIDFTDEGEINNAIILANNGVGKSSIFAGLEMVYAQEIGEKKLRSTSENVINVQFDEYLQRFGSSKKPYCKVVSEDKEGGLNNPFFSSAALLKTFNPSNHFVSDYDIFHYGRVNFTGDSDDKSSFHSIVANSLGLSDFIQFQDVISSIRNYRRLKESSNLKRLKNERVEKKKTVININEILDRNIKELKDLNDSNSALGSSSLDNAQKTRQSINRSLPKLPSSEEIEKAITAFNKNYNRLLSGDNKAKIDFEHEFFEAAKHLLHDASDCPLCQNSNSSVDEIIALVEQRLLELKKQHSAEQDLKGNFKFIFEIINRFFLGFKEVIDFIQTEKEVIRSESDLRDLLELEESIYQRFAPLLIDSEMFDFVNEMANKFSIGTSEFEKTNQFLEGPIIKGLNQIVDDFNNLNDKRNKLTQEWLEKNKRVEGTPMERKIQLEQEIIRLETQLKDHEKRLTELEPEIKRAELISNRVDQVKQGVGEYFPKLESEISNIVIASFEPLKEIVESVMKDYLTESNLDLSISIENRPISEEEAPKQIIVAQIIDTQTEEIITPDKYFNSFRYKLFAVMISLSLALATRQKYKINLPLVMDDLFAGSDFLSKNSFSDFLIKVIQLFNKYTPDLPLQFILFTHDDLIFRSAIDAVENVIESNDAAQNKDISEVTIVGRIFEAKISPENLVSKENGFYNMLYKIPKTILIN